MKQYKYIIYLLLTIFMVSGCQKRFDELTVDPNRASTVPPNVLLAGLLNGLGSGLGGVEPWGAVPRYNQYYCRNYQYYGDNAYVFNNGPFSVYSGTLKNIQRMEVEAKKIPGTGDLNPYSAAAKFLYAYYYYNLASLMGDVPQKDALGGLEGVYAPKYDSQKEIFLQMIKWLDEANDDFGKLITAPSPAGSTFLNDDFFFKADYTKWRKLVNAFKLRVLIALSKKSGDGDLKVAERFAEVMGNSTKYPLPAGMQDNLAYKYNNDINRYPTNPISFGFDALRYNMASTWVDNLKVLKDPRLFATCEPAWKIADAANLQPTDFNAYSSIGIGENQSTMEQKAIGYEISHINRYRYYRGFVAEDFIIVGYPEMCFNIAEGINRGWFNGNAEEWYKKGIESMLGFYGIVDGSNVFNFLRPGKSLGEWITATYMYNFNTYYNQPEVKYELGPGGLTKILLQKYLGFFQNSGWEAFYNQRRTGIPAFNAGPGTGNGGTIPKRWTYPVSEQNVNNANWKAAVERQFGGKDDVNAEIWLIK
jgi:hypothetical protein